MSAFRSYARNGELQVAVMEQLQDGPKTRRDIRGALNRSTDSVTQTVRRLIARGVVEEHGSVTEKVIGGGRWSEQVRTMALLQLTEAGRRGLEPRKRAVQVQGFARDFDGIVRSAMGQRHPLELVWRAGVVA